MNGMGLAASSVVPIFITAKSPTAYERWLRLEVAILAGALVFKANQESGGKELGSGVLKGGTWRQ